MANTIHKQVLMNESKNYIIKYTIIGDGSGDQTHTLVNANTGDMGVKNRIRRVIGNLSGFSAQLLFDATTPLFAWQIPSDFPTDNKFIEFGGLINDAGSGVTGDIDITTSGLGTGDSGSIVIWVEKS